MRVDTQVEAEVIPDLRRAIALVAPRRDVVERARELHSEWSSHTTTASYSAKVLVQGLGRFARRSCKDIQRRPKRLGPRQLKRGSGGILRKPLDDGAE